MLVLKANCVVEVEGRVFDHNQRPSVHSSGVQNHARLLNYVHERVVVHNLSHVTVLERNHLFVYAPRQGIVQELPLSCAALPWASSKCWAAATPFGRTTRTSYEPRKKNPWTWRIISFSKWLAFMASFRPLRIGLWDPFHSWPFHGF